MELNKLTERIIGCAMQVHSELGPGLLESAYEKCLCYELQQNGMDCVAQLPMPLKYKDVKLDAGYRIDVLVENKVVVEIKSVEAFTDVHVAQVITYLKLSECQIGLLINFNVKSLKTGIKRIANNYTG